MTEHTGPLEIESCILCEGEFAKTASHSLCPTCFCLVVFQPFLLNYTQANLPSEKSRTNASDCNINPFQENITLKFKYKQLACLVSKEKINGMEWK